MLPYNREAVAVIVSKAAGAAEGCRTPDLRIANPTLSQQSCRPVACIVHRAAVSRGNS